MPVRITPFDPSAANQSAWDAFYALRRVRHAELEADFFLRSSAQMREDLCQQANHIAERRWVMAGNDGMVLGTLYAAAITPACANYDERRHLVEADLYVRPEHRRKGFGRRLLSTLGGFMDQVGATVATLSTNNPQGMEFAKAIGADEKMRDLCNRLRLDGIDWRMVDSWRAAPGVDLTVTAFPGRVPQGEWPALMPFINAALKDIPVGSLDNPIVEFTAEMWSEWYRQADRLGSQHHMLLLRDGDGAIAGFTDVGWNPREPHRLSQILTAVRPDLRGQGVAKGLKAAMLLYIREHLPQVTEVITGNAKGNAPMLEINRQLGFQRIMTRVLYQVGRGGLE
jgi:GNAT superfamily N-acetyltransferase